jgi:mevalonate kinase
VLSSAELASHAFVVEHDLLGVECGQLDPTACAAGEPTFMRWELDGSSSVHMDVRRVRPGARFHLVVGIFGRPRDTQSILKTLSDWNRAPLGDADGDAVREALRTFASAAEQGARALSNGDAISLGEAMNTAQQAYEESLSDRAPALSAPMLRRTCAHATGSLEAIGAKFSGAGGDGSFVALFMNEAQARTAALELEQMGLRAWYVPVEAT